MYIQCGIGLVMLGAPVGFRWLLTDDTELRNPQKAKSRLAKTFHEVRDATTQTALVTAYSLAIPLVHGVSTHGN